MVGRLPFLECELIPSAYALKARLGRADSFLCIVSARDQLARLAKKYCPKQSYNRAALESWMIGEFFKLVRWTTLIPRFSEPSQMTGTHALWLS